MKILGAILEPPAKQHCHYLKIGLNWPNRQCCLAGSSKTAPRILIFFNWNGCQSFILCENYWDPCTHIFAIQYFSYKHCDPNIPFSTNSTFEAYHFDISDALYFFLHSIYIVHNVFLMIQLWYLYQHILSHKFW